MTAGCDPEPAQRDVLASDARVPGSDQEAREGQNQNLVTTDSAKDDSKDGGGDSNKSNALAASSANDQSQIKAVQDSSLESSGVSAPPSNSKDSRLQGEQQSPWFLSALEGSMRSFTRLLASGVDVNLTTSRGTSALHLSAKRGAAPFCEALIAARADVNKPANNGYTPLHYAVDSTSPLSVCTALLNAKVSVDAQNASGATALHMATASDNEAICKLLRSASASDTIPDNAGQTSAAIQKEKEAAAEQRRAKRKRQRVEQQQASAVKPVAVDSDEEVEVVL